MNMALLPLLMTDWFIGGIDITGGPKEGERKEIIIIYPVQIQATNLTQETTE